MSIYNNSVIINPFDFGSFFVVISKKNIAAIISSRKDNIRGNVTGINRFG
ncbi:hypothetical protein RCG17_01300 [Neobacillus sp. PS3-12]|nr:hypothetical protein [Neobacillus sp. PS3-12]WML53372.1 hypothetical protein RCG17_01300 [Neobacillus sp. PS3-12]